jgi:exopolysaccharide biosynthesis polyprenyl glycosylphosphotransferase
MSTLVSDGKPAAAASALQERLDKVGDTPQAGIQAFAKRLLDFIVALTLIVLLLPVFVGVGLLILFDSGWPVIFTQERLGLRGRPFVVFKFRSMERDAEKRRGELEANNEIKDGPIFKWRADPRITRVGRFLRKTSLDELPQLFNVLIGNMSLVGPRPPLESEVIHYEESQLRRLAAKPGMTGLWQVSGRSSVGFTQMVQLDIQYIEEWSFWSDVKILIKTPLVVLRNDGAY